MSAPRVIEPLAAIEQAAFDLVEALIRRDLGRTKGLSGDRTRDVTIEISAQGYVRVLVGVSSDPSRGAAWIADKRLGEAFEAARAVLLRSERG